MFFTRTFGFTTCLIFTIVAGAAVGNTQSDDCEPQWDGAIGQPGVDDEFDPLPSVRALAVYDDGTGPALYAGGSFTTAGGQAANRIVKWDGNNWSPLGDGIGGISPTVYALTVFDDGTGPALYVGGNFSHTGDLQEVNHIAKWDGSS